MSASIVLNGLVAGDWASLPFEDFREGVTIHHIVKGEPALALLKYEPGASVPRHRHAGLETIVVLSGAQSDENGTYAAGAVMANPEGSEHSVWSATGCVVLIQWTRPVIILDGQD